MLGFRNINSYIKAFRKEINLYIQVTNISYETHKINNVKIIKGTKYMRVN